MTILVINSRVANLHSVVKALQLGGAAVQITDRYQDFAGARAIVLPGVGAFDAGMTALQQKDLIHPLQDWAAKGKPLLGICLGLQMLFERSAEGEKAGLGILKGDVQRLPALPAVPLPHMGWNRLEICGSASSASTSSASTSSAGDGWVLWQHLPAHPWVYFVHSYYVEPVDKMIVTATTDYGGFHPAVAVGQGNIMGLQFHPEKSGPIGLQILKNFVQYAGVLAETGNYG
ncbi:MAG: imidazole glycerol phosphate synthase subunit HisH [Pseudanabaenaceae cyanobacterium SKYGB_i_bin29]|nr:imidazole glycerol phosphate synthase subunit HisH [Pseudanabaenaceae cyanobacterium SKYG29]MDW8420960.1 imidazole glycerol phosphate synthase subunit HisH [Pseudanabaenaceae cyanobacterium SKYGB_i_bin29]